MLPALPLLALLFAAAGFAQSPIDALDPLTREIYVDAQRLERDGALLPARVKYRQVLDRDPAWTQAVIDLGRVLQALEDLEGAEAIYRTAPYEADVVAALGRLLMATDRHAEAATQFARMRNLRPDTAEFLVLEAQATGASDPLRGREVLLEYLGRPNAKLATEGGMAAAAGVAQALREAGKDEEASKLLDALTTRLTEEGVSPEGPHMEQVEALRDRFEVERQARDLAAVASEPLTPEQRGWLNGARARYRAGEHQEAAATLQQILDETPGNADTWAALSDTRLALGDVAGAERALRTAERLAPLESNHAARLGDLLYEQYGGRCAAEAASAYARALSRHDADPSLWYRRGLAELRARKPGAAAASMRRYLELAPVDLAEAEEPPRKPCFGRNGVKNFFQTANEVPFESPCKTASIGGG